MTTLTTIFLILFLLGSGLLLYVYIGYPLIIVALARLSRKPVQKNAEYLPTVTLVIPAHNEEIVIEKKLENALSLDYPRERLQIIVCDDTSSDRTVEIVKRFASRGIELSEGLTRSGKVGGLNRALSLATGEIYVITDADITLSPNSLRELAANFADKSVGCVVAQTRMMSSAEHETSESGGLYWRYEALIRQNESDLHSTVAATGHLQGIRRDIMQPIPENVILDDFYLAMMTSRAGYRVISDPKSIVWERPTSSIGDDVNRRRRLTAGRYQMLFMSGAYFPKLPALLRFQVVSHKFLRLGIPHFMILALLSNLLLAFTLSGMSALMRVAVLAALAAQTVFYLMALAGKLLSGREGKKSKLVKLFTLPYFLCATNFASIAGLLWYFSGQHTVLWQQAKRD